MNRQSSGFLQTGLEGAIRRDRGTALVMSLVVLLILTILGVAAMGTSTLEEKMAGNVQEATRAFQAAETGLIKGMADGTAFDLGQQIVKTYQIADGKAGTVEVTTKFLQFSPVKRGSGHGYNNFEIANFDQKSVGTTKSNARATVHQGTSLVIPKPN